MFKLDDSYFYGLAIALFSGASLFTAENVSFVAAVVGAIFTFVVFLFKKINIVVKDYSALQESVHKIEKEVKLNGGSSLKDAVVAIKNVLSRIEVTQKVIEQRTKSSLHCHDYALFEVDKHGKLTWANEKFLSMTGCTTCDVGGLDWLNIVLERDRQGFIQELTSCLEMCRKFDFDTTVNLQKAKFIGHPYKIDEDKHAGFLLRLVL